MENTTREEAIGKIRDLIEGIDFAMLTTVAADGTLHSRPMSTQKVEFDGDLWFFTNAASHKIDEIRDDSHVNVSYSAPEKQNYISVSGRASVVRDRAKMEELWNPVLKAWFPDGLDSPDIALLKVSVDSAEYWDSPSSTVAHAIGLAKALLTGEGYEPGEHAKVSFKP
jgi:general stress protein 26